MTKTDFFNRYDIDFWVTDDVKSFVKNYLAQGSIAHRGKFDGTPEQQEIGMWGQVVVGDFLKLTRPTNEKKFDGGFDVNWNGVRGDVKTSIRNQKFSSRWAHNLNGYQINYPTEGYIFCSYNKTNNTMTISGSIAKEKLKEKGELFAEGAKRADGTDMIVGAGGMWEIRDRHLTKFEMKL